MASSSSKKIASANAKTLQELHYISLAVNVSALVALFLFHRPSSSWKYIVLSMPAFGCQLVLERSGRPTYSIEPQTNHKILVRSGDDIKGQGLFEYMFDCIYVTWICDILMIIFGSNKVWFLYAIIPGFLIYKVTQLVRMFFGGKSKVASPEADTKTADSGKSKRQAKLEKRGQKQQRVRG